MRTFQSIDDEMGIWGPLEAQLTVEVFRFRVLSSLTTEPWNYVALWNWSIRREDVLATIDEARPPVGCTCICLIMFGFRIGRVMGDYTNDLCLFICLFLLPSRKSLITVVSLGRWLGARTACDVLKCSHIASCHLNVNIHDIPLSLWVYRYVNTTSVAFDGVI